MHKYIIHNFLLLCFTFKGFFYTQKLKIRYFDVLDEGLQELKLSHFYRKIQIFSA